MAGLIRIARSWPLLVGLGMASAAPAQAPRVAIEGGQVEGVAVAGQPIRAFLGLPYAAAPVGTLRWRAPQPVPAWTGVRAATRFGARCMQQRLFEDMVFRSPGVSEDCLFVNVWTPAGGGSAKHPVLVYIHGGGFVAGDGSEPRYDGASMAARGIVAVTLNYRLGTFGLLAHPELTAENGARGSGNYALLDQIAALAWVRRNIAAFGGDPDRVTVAGESAGSMSVSALMAAPAARPLFAQAIGESGALMEPTFVLPSLAAAERTGRDLAQAMGATDLAALRAMPADRLLASTPKGTRLGLILDGEALPRTPDAVFAAGDQARVPLLVGANSEEGGAGAILGELPPTVANYRDALNRLFGARAQTAFELYPAATDAEVRQAATDLASDRFLGFATWKWFDRHRRSGLPTFGYRFTRVRPPALSGPASPRPLGAVHSAEIEYALGNLDTHPSYAWTAEDRAVSGTMQGYFANFIRTGDPNGPGLPHWAPGGSAEDRFARQRIDVDTRTETVTDLARYRSMEQLLATP